MEQKTAVEFAFEKLEKLETLAKILAKCWYYGNFKVETPNERVMQMLMCELGYFPFNDEDEMIKQTKVNDELYKEAIKIIK